MCVYARVCLGTVLDGVVDLATVNRIIANLTEVTEAEFDPFQVISAFEVPAFKYSLDRKAFLPYVLSGWLLQWDGVVSAWHFCV